MSKEENNKVLVGRWFTEFWGETCKLSVVDELAAPDMLLQYSLHAPRRGREDIKAFMSGFREAFPDLNFWGAADLSRRVTMWSVAAGRQIEPAPTDHPQVGKVSLPELIGCAGWMGEGV